VTGPGTNIVVLGQDGRRLTAVVNGSAAAPFDAAALPPGGGVVVSDAPTWWVRNNLDESTAPWADRDELDQFLVALHRADYEARSLSVAHTKKLCKLKGKQRPALNALAAALHDQVAVLDGTALWCGTCETHTSLEVGRPVRVSAHAAEPGMAIFTPTSAFHADTRPVVAFDWSLKGVHATSDGVTVDRFADIDALVDALEEPTKLAAESTFESWDPARRTHALELIRGAGHELYVYRPLHTSRRRPDALAKTDADDARVIYSLAVDGRFHLHPAVAEPDIDRVRRRIRSNRAYVRIRLAEGKPELAAAAETILGPYGDLDPELARALGNGGSYSGTLLAAVWIATTRTRSRDDFEDLLGLSGSGYPSLLRSEIHTHVWRHADGRGITWTAFRRAVRRARSILIAGGVQAVDDDSTSPDAAELAAALLDAGFPLTAEQAERAAAAIAT
jgi:hypothetical protein